MTRVQPPGLCSAAQPRCGGRGVSRTMQFFKSSLILLVAFRVALYHGGDLGLAQGSAPVLSEEGLLEVAKFPLQPPCCPPPSPHHPRESLACRLRGAPLTPPLARTLGKPLSQPSICAAAWSLFQVRSCRQSVCIQGRAVIPIYRLGSSRGRDRGRWDLGWGQGATSYVLLCLPWRDHQHF